MKRIWLIGALAMGIVAKGQDVYICRNVEASFFSSAPVENISARTDQGFSALSLKEKTIYCKIPIRSFAFRKSLMQEHFNDNYLESDKYPYAEFSGRILSGDISQKGDHPVVIEGQLAIHGVSKQYKIEGNVHSTGNEITADAQFSVRLADHHIKIPALLFHNIAEVVDVKIAARYSPKQ
jgi:hypothetical protein